MNVSEEAFLMANAEKRTAEERARLVSEQRSSGMTQKAWCAEHGIKWRTFRDWARLSNRGKAERAGSAGWIELPGRGHDSAAPMEVSAGLFTVLVKPGFGRGMLSDICRTLAGLC
jgi:hypothetical protein